MCPSRSRPEDLASCFRTVLKTSNAHMVAYIDGDEQDLYREDLAEFKPNLHGFNQELRRERDEGSRLSFLRGPRIGPVAAANRIAHLYRDFTIYGMVPDDCQFLTPGWDRFLEEKLNHETPHVVAAYHNGGDYVNFPWVNRAWIEVVGWYYYPNNFHHCGDTLLEILGECSNAITYARESEMAMHHDLKHDYNREKYPQDCENFLTWCIGERRDLVKRLKQKIAEGLPV